MAAAADLRNGEAWSLAQRAKNDLLYGLVVVALAIVGWMPARILRWLGVALGALAWAIIPSARRIALANVARVMPHLDDRARRALVRRVYRTLGENLGDAVAMLDASRTVELLPFAPGARETLERARSERRGVLFASAHLGPWERVAATIAATKTPFTVVAREPYDPRLGQLYDRLRAARGLRAIYRGAPGSGASLLRVLRRGEVLGIPMDLRSRVPSVDAPFLGIPARTPVGPARLALRTGAAVVVGVPARIDGALVVTVIEIETLDLQPSATSEAILTARINAALSDAILALPEAWVWMHPRFGEGTR